MVPSSIGSSSAVASAWNGFFVLLPLLRCFLYPFDKRPCAPDVPSDDDDGAPPFLMVKAVTEEMDPLTELVAVEGAVYADPASSAAAFCSQLLL